MILKLNVLPINKFVYMKPCYALQNNFINMGVLSRFHLFKFINRRNISSAVPSWKNKSYLSLLQDDMDENTKQEIVKLSCNTKIKFNSYINENTILVATKNPIVQNIIHKSKSNNSVPLILENIQKKEKELMNDEFSSKDHDTESDDVYPFQECQSIDYTDGEHFFSPNQNINTTEKEIKIRLNVKSLLLNRMDNEPKLSCAYSNYHPENVEFLELQKLGYGVPDPTIAASDINCKGCGAYFHCHNESLPGYIPSESFLNTTPRDKRRILCQRCYFLKYHNIPLNVRVDPSEYTKVLTAIQNCNCLAVVVVDLFDVPCSIWPGIDKLLGTKRPVIVVGNKVDLLPPDGPDHLKYVEETLKECIKQTSLGKSNITDIQLVSAKTGYGIEDLVTKIHSRWGTKGDVFIVGTTNSGKSTLFNALLGSDLCHSAASQLLTRATSSLWPGTTLSLLKFPLQKMTVEKAEMRRKHLETNKKMDYFRDETDFHSTAGYTRNFESATLKGSIAHTYKDHFFAHNLPKAVTRRKEKGDDIEYEDILVNRTKKWCYDTPGTIQSDQIINLLTHNELMKTLPTTIMEPRTFILLKGQTIFIGGIARMDIVYSSEFVRMTVFSSTELPITIVNTIDASEVYRDNLGSKLFNVPFGSAQRLEQWPVLKGRNFFVTGLGYDQSCCDIVLASCAFVSPSTAYNQAIDMRAWTPAGRGIYLRKNSILPRTVTLRGKRIEDTPEYGSHTTYIPEYEKDNVHHSIHGQRNSKLA